MTRIACLALFLASIACAQATEARIHDVSFLTTPIPDQPGDSLGAFDPGGVEQAQTEWEPFTVEQLADLVRRDVQPEGWAAGNEVQTLAGALCVRAPAEVQEAVARLLAGLASSIGPQVQVDVRRVRVSAALFAKLAPAGPLDERRVKAIQEALAAKTDAVAAGESRVTAFSGQRVHVKSATTVAYIRDYDAQIAQESAMADPVPADVQEGVLVDVRPLVSPDGKSIAIECRLRSASLLSMETFDTGTPLLGAVQLPEIETTSLMTNVVVPDRGLALAGAALLPAERREKGIRYEVLLVSATLLGPPPSAPPRDGSKPIRVIDVGYLVNAYPDFPGPDVSLATSVDGAGASFTMGPEPSPLPMPADLVALVSGQVAPGTWIADHILEPTSGRIIAKNSADAMAQLDRFLLDLARPVGRSVSVEVRFLAVDAPSLAALSAEDGPLTSGMPDVSDEQVAKVLARAQAEDGVREVGVGMACGLAGRRFSISTLRTTAYVQDYDVQIATKSKIGDPVVGALTVGTVLDVRPQVSPDGKSILLDLRPVHAEAAGSVDALDTRSGDIGKIHLPSVRSHETRSSLLVRDGQWRVVGLGGHGEDGGAIVVLVRATSIPSK